MSNKQIHVLQQPLRIASENQNQYYLLPMGTTLYYDASLPEGSDRFYIYINIEGNPLELVPLERPDLVIPLTAYSFEGEDIINLIKDYPVNKKDLIQILNTDSLSKDDAQEIINHLQQFIETHE
ncbi:MAG: hypothetical protein QNL62_02235 [Gammaproteobacteria bacterium]|nr:hypothetical protein [Gammaproteobacteria bacterium]